MPTRARGTLSDGQVDAAYPHQAEVEVPWDGLGKRLDAMIAWAGRHPSRRRSEGRDRLRFCFTDAATAEAFQIEFGGRRVTAEPPRVRRPVW